MAHSALGGWRGASGVVAIAAALALTPCGPAQAGSSDPTFDASSGASKSEDDAPKQAAFCGGVDLIRALQASDPASFERFDSAARMVVNGAGLLWRVDAPGKPPSYLFGTMHSSETFASSFDDLVIRALSRSKLVATELPGASTRRVANELRRLVGSRSFRPQGGSLDALSDNSRVAVENRLASIGISRTVAPQLQPWFLALSLSRSNCSATAARSGAPQETADARIERLALEQGATVLGLETPAEQVDALASVPDEVALRMLRDAAERRVSPEDFESTITGLYSARRIGYLLAMRGQNWAGVLDGDGYADFITAFVGSFITRRNHAMAVRAAPILAQGEAFVAVGALHLPGEEGMVELIRRQGFSVSRIW
jgi:uncharacterized protein YbaP (TraB family)